MFKEKTVPFSDSELELLFKHLRQELGIVIQENHSSLVYTHLKRRMEQLGYKDFTNYYHQALSQKQEERQHLTNLITNNKTHFFRESIQLDYIRDTLLPEIELRTIGERKIRIWSAASSTGEEPYTLAILLSEYFGPEWDIKILASDINTNVLRQASKGIYPAEAMAAIDSDLVNKYFTPVDDKATHYQVVPELRQMVQFRQINLIDDHYPLIKTEFDLILCRNVTIYFAKDMIQALLLRLHKLLKNDGHLAIGVAESLEFSEQYFAKRRFNIYKPTILQNSTTKNSPVIVIGGSTGAVNAVEKLLRALPAETPGIVVAIHISTQYSNSYAERLNRQVAMQVREAQQGDRITPGVVLISPGDMHISLNRNQKEELCITLSKRDIDDTFVPSVNRLFSSTSTVAQHNAIGVLLTGMGSDGADGLLKMRKQAARTITQNRESCVIYGMPKAAEALNASELSCDLKRIPEALLHAVPLVGKEEHSNQLRHWKRANFIKLKGEAARQKQTT